MENIESGVKTLAPIQGESLALSSISIEEQTLSAVLIHALPSGRRDDAEDNAKVFAKAVRAAFSQLREPAPHICSIRIGVNVDSTSLDQIEGQLQRIVNLKQTAEI